MERCNGNDNGRCKGVRRGVTAVSTLRDNLTFIVSVSLRKYDIFYMIYFLKLTLPQYYFNHSFLQQAFTRKSKNSCRFKNIQGFDNTLDILDSS